MKCVSKNAIIRSNEREKSARHWEMVGILRGNYTVFLEVIILCFRGNSNLMRIRNSEIYLLIYGQLFHLLAWYDLFTKNTYSCHYLII